MTDHTTLIPSATRLGAISLGAALLMATSASAHFIGVGGNNSIDGSLCVGFDCVAEEAFGFDTIRLKENNLRIHFEDTSVAASFPPNDWRIIINDSANGGASYFGVEDTSGGTIPFRVSAGARNHALFVDSQGDVGIGTSTPATDIDIKIGDTPTVRLQQDGTSGFTPQTWDMAGNETNFFIRDVTNGSLLPFRIRPDAPTNSLMIDGTGFAGLNTASPAAPLHILRNVSSNEPHVLVQTTTEEGRPEIWLRDSSVGDDLRLQLDQDDFNISFNGTGGAEFRVSKGGDVSVLRGDLLVTNGDLITSGSGNCAPPNPPCDAVFDAEAYTVPTIEEHAALMWQNKYLPAVGATGPGKPIDVTEKLLRMLNELEHAHIYIDQLNQRVAVLEGQLAAQQ